MSNPSLNAAVDEVASPSASGGSKSSTPVAAGKPVRGGSMGLPFIVVVLICAAAGIGVFGMTEFQAAGELRTEVGALRSEVSTLTATVGTLQTENDHYKGVLSRVQAATGSLQASLAELNELAGSAP